MHISPSPSERIIYRSFRLEDARDMYLLNKDPDVIMYTGDSPFETVEQAAGLIAEYDMYHKYGYGRWTLILKGTGEYIGWCGLKYNDDIGETDLGFRLLKKFWGQGLATEAARHCIDYAFHSLQLDRLIGRAALENVASIRVLEKTGFIFLEKQQAHGMDIGYYELKK